MANMNVKMTVDEFVRKIIDGERDFCKIELEPGMPLEEHEGFSALHSELSMEPAEHPLILSRANLSGIRIKGDLCLDYCIARGTDFSKSRLSYIHFRNANLTRASFSSGYQSWVMFEGARLNYTNFDSMAMEDGNLRGADVFGADLSNCRITRSDLRGIKNLDKAWNMADATFLYVMADRSDRRAIRKALDKRRKQLFAKDSAPCRG